MTINTQACDSRRIMAYLDGELDAIDEQAFQLHLEACPACREHLEELAATPESWQEAERLLQPEFYDRREMDGAGPDLQVQPVLDALAPTDDPDMLGRCGAYEVSGVIGAGGMGIVFKATDKSLDRRVAIKVLAPHLASSGAARTRFAREAKAAAAVLHPNVIAIHSVSTDRQLPHLVMPYIAGTSLQKRLDQSGPLPVPDVLRIAQQIASGLSAAHAQGLVHRDIKPANILLEDGVERVTITDFGLARAVDDATITRSGVIAGTPQFMSPEQARGEPVDPRSDLFSLGSLMYAMCTGRPPFRADTTFGVIRRITEDSPTAIQSLNPDIPAWLCHIIDKLMSKDAFQRYQSAERVSVLLETCVAHCQQPNNVDLPKELQRFQKKPLGPIQGWMSVCLLMLGVFGGWLGINAWQSSPPPDISGKWTGDGWGDVKLQPKGKGKYEGTYTDTYGDAAGTISLSWSKRDGRFNGEWRESDARLGKISVHLVDGEIWGAWRASKKSEIKSGVPRLADLRWVRGTKKSTDGGPKETAHVEKFEGHWRLMNYSSKEKKDIANVRAVIDAERVTFFTDLPNTTPDVYAYEHFGDGKLRLQAFRDGELRDVILARYHVEGDHLWIACNVKDGGSKYPPNPKLSPEVEDVSYFQLERIGARESTRRSMSRIQLPTSTTGADRAPPEMDNSSRRSSGPPGHIADFLDAIVDGVQAKQLDPEELASRLGAAFFVDQNHTKSLERLREAFASVGKTQGILEAKRKLPEPRSWLTGDETAREFHFLCDVERLIPEAEQVINTWVGGEIFRDALAGIKQDVDGPQVDILGDLVQHMSGEAMAVCFPSTEPGKKGLTMFAFVLEDRPASIQTALKKIAFYEATATAQTNANGSELYVVGNERGTPPVAFTVAGDLLILGHAELVKAALNHRPQ